MNSYDTRWTVKRAAARATMNPLRPGQRLTPPQKCVLMQLAALADDSGCCWPGVARLAERTGFSERCVRGALRDLEGMGLVRTVRGGGRGRSNDYALQMGALQLAVAPAAAPEKPAPDAGQGFDSSDRNPASDDTKPGTSCPRIKKNQTRNTPPTPSRGLEPRRANGRGKRPGTTDALPELLSLKDWLAQCQQRGEQAIPGDDPVFSYAASIGLSTDLVVLAWQQFKRRRLGAGKRQRDWRRAFRDSVETCAYRLWRFGADGEPVLSTEGQQAERFFAQAGETVSA